MNRQRDQSFQPTVDRYGSRRRPVGAVRGNLLAGGLSLGLAVAAAVVAVFDHSLAARLGDALLPVFVVLSVLSVVAFFALANLPRAFDLLGRKSALVLTLLSVVAFNWLAYLIFRLVRLALADISPK